MRAYTSPLQSVSLGKFLPLESADMYYHTYPSYKCWHGVPNIGKADLKDDQMPCWSLASLLNYLREIDFFPTIEADEHSVTMSVCYYDEEEGSPLNPIHDIIIKAETFIDACYGLICKLHEQNIL